MARAPEVHTGQRARWGGHRAEPTEQRAEQGAEPKVEPRGAPREEQTGEQRADQRGGTRERHQLAEAGRQASDAHVHGAWPAGPEAAAYRLEVGATGCD